MKVKENFPCSQSIIKEGLIRSDCVLLVAICGRKRKEFWSDKTFYESSTRAKSNLWRLASDWVCSVYYEEYSAWPEEEVEV